MKINYSVVKDMQKIYKKVSDDIFKENKIVAWFQGGSEFGPRALGFRSIFANPLNAEMKNHINKNIKYREWWRPFAPVILETHVRKYFPLHLKSQYMLFSQKFDEFDDQGHAFNKDFTSVSNVDGTARYQTVNKDDNEKLYYLLLTCDELHKCPMLLNTSFNINNEPIVETPKHAYDTFLNSNIDVLVMENVYIKKIYWL